MGLDIQQWVIWPPKNRNLRKHFKILMRLTWTKKLPRSKDWQWRKADSHTQGESWRQQSKGFMSSIKHCPFLSDLTKFSNKVIVHKIIPCNISTYAKLNILLKETNNFATKQMF